MVKVDVCEKQVSQISKRYAFFCQTRFQTRQRRARSAFDQDKRITVPDQISGNCLRASLKLQIKCDNTGLRHDMS